MAFEWNREGLGVYPALLDRLSAFLAEDLCRAGSHTADGADGFLPAHVDGPDLVFFCIDHHAIAQAGGVGDKDHKEFFLSLIHI